MKNACIEMAMNMIAGVNKNRLNPTAIVRQPEAVSFVRKTARPGGCAPTVCQKAQNLKYATATDTCGVDY